MAYNEAADILRSIFALMLVFAPIAMFRGGPSAGRRRTKAKTAVREPKRRPAKKQKVVMKKQAPKAKAADRPLSDFENRILTDYFVRRDFAR